MSLIVSLIIAILLARHHGTHFWIGLITLTLANLIDIAIYLHYLQKLVETFLSAS